MTVRRTFQWLVALLLTAAVGGGAYAWKLWDQRDLLLEATLKAKLPELFPGWNLRFGRVQFDWYRRIRVRDVALVLGEGDVPSLAVPELLITVDRRELTENQRIVVQKVRLIGATVDVVRAADGRWNWLDLPPPKKSDGPSPEFEIERGTLRLRLDPSDGGPPATMSFKQVELKLIPSGRRAYVVKGATNVQQAGPLAFEARFDVEAKTWSLDGQLRNVLTNGDLLNLAAGFSPEFRRNLGKIETALRKVRLATRGEEARPRTPAVSWAGPKGRVEELADARGRRAPSAQFVAMGAVDPAGAVSDAATDAVATAENVDSSPVPDFGVSALMDVRIHAEQRSPEKPPDFQLNVGLRQGQVKNDILPFGIEEVEGDLYWDRQKIEIRRLDGRAGLTRVAFGGTLERVDGQAPGAFGLRVENLSLDEELQKRLPPAARRIYDSLQPSGPVDIECAVVYDGQSKWTPQNLLVTAKGCEVAHVKFPYRVTDVIGTVTQEGDDLKLLFEGRVGRRPALLQGTIHRPGPAAEIALEITAKQVPVDDVLIAACPKPVQEPLTSLNLRGYGDADVRLYRPPGLGQKMQIQISGKMNRGVLEYDRFPLRLTNFSGKLNYSSVKELWTFEELEADHGAARIRGGGSFSRENPPGRLDLALSATDLPLDQSLEQALPDTLVKLWNDLAPTGVLKNVETVVSWTPGEQPEISLPTLEVTKGSITPKAFPYLFEQVEATGSWKEGRLELTSFVGKHDEMPISAEGFCETTPEGEWRLRMQNASVKNLVMDRSFRKALPAALLEIVESADPQGSVSLSGTFELRGAGGPNDAVTAYWNGVAEFPGNILNAGLTLKNLRGTVTSEGTWDGRIADIKGTLNLDTVTLLDHHVEKVQGPYAFRDRQLILGSAEALLPDRGAGERRRLPREQRVIGKAIGGELVLDASAFFHETPTWAAKLILSEGKLEEYARLYMPRTNNIRGVMNGWIDLKGRGSTTGAMTGRGKVQVSPAALYELPLMVQMFRAVSVTPQDRTAFRYAYTEFALERNQFQFGVIDLVGDAISFRGNGTAGLNGQLKLDFYSYMPRSRIAVPVLNLIAGELSKGWVGVEVRGQVSAPQARVKAVPQVDDALKRFLGAFNPKQSAPLQTLPTLPTFREN